MLSFAALTLLVRWVASKNRLRNDLLCVRWDVNPYAHSSLLDNCYSMRIIEFSLQILQLMCEKRQMLMERDEYAERLNTLKIFEEVCSFSFPLLCFDFTVFPLRATELSLFFVIPCLELSTRSRHVCEFYGRRLKTRLFNRWFPDHLLTVVPPPHLLEEPVVIVTRHATISP